MSVVYLVSTGEYSDYRIVAACSTREIAEGLVRAMRDDASVEVLEVDKYRSVADSGLQVYQVRFDDDGGSSINSWITDVSYLDDEHFNDASQVVVLARDERHAIKVASDKRAQFMAEPCVEFKAHWWGGRRQAYCRKCGRNEAVHWKATS